MAAGANPAADLALVPVLVCPTCAVPLRANDVCSCGLGAVDPAGFRRCLPPAGASDARVQAFYETLPFPDYEDLDGPRALRERARHSGFARWLDEQLPLSGLVLEAGCGTGQLTNFLSLSQRHTVGLDFSAASLAIATAFRDRFALEHAHFVQGDVLRPPFAAGTFHTVISLGVLHHTLEPLAAFLALVRLLAPGGHFVLGLYNRYGRLRTLLRRALVRTLGRWTAGLDPNLRQFRGNRRRRTAWIEDQYFHPRERRHTVDEVLGWFDRAGLEYVNAVPGIVVGEHAAGELFAPGIRGSRADHLLSQLAWVLGAPGREGGLFVLIGRRR